MKKLFNILSILSLFAILLQFFYLEKNKKFYNNTFIDEEDEEGNEMKNNIIELLDISDE
ncbi:hypothetical protein [Staphylococcus sp. GDY8P120P]|uniref:hypothetical protein n=1 Tax=Staphylococcus sp. GDY8P120P TaxID=2804156 RepID=UPI001AEBC02B|nr:hypothetical protein [Staphylococcus sp. GDY8P120P]